MVSNTKPELVETTRDRRRFGEGGSSSGQLGHASTPLDSDSEKARDKYSFFGDGCLSFSSSGGYLWQPSATALAQLTKAIIVGLSDFDSILVLIVITTLKYLAQSTWCESNL